ncbi:response regulator transcription factor [Brevibacterium sp. 91QC2O2]|uniref:response regulator transcription factor n=1 Tax=Brevibacterium sp. 91QC2O2 TaxID=2968458 RepID=UPI00211C7014|nr:response regulator transcription factor [Brevibacterium sp. 91QC2O2]MCQ9369426.1 response regulator transcription factor [Brevibacterium sp. 91QC2O2]
MLSVLIADDDHWATRGLARALAGEPELLVLPPVHSGAEAVAAHRAHRAHRPSVTLMDLRMPGEVNGIDAIKAIRGEDPAARILVITAEAPGPQLVRAIEAGALGVIGKAARDEAVRTAVLAAGGAGTGAGGDEPRLLCGLVDDLLVAGDPRLMGEPHRAGEPCRTGVSRFGDQGAAPVVPEEPTAAELAVLKEVVRGKGYAQIAEDLFISVATAKSHTKALRRKLHAGNLAQLVVRALEYGYVS